MKFLLLVHHNESEFSKLDDLVKRDMLAESVRLTHTLESAKLYLNASPLVPSQSAAKVQVRNGKRSVTDGPFVETHEQIAGYFMVEAKDLNEAISISEKVPGARIGTVEVRQIFEIEGLPKGLHV
ncbi:MAG: YciI family protein [Burkholderiales bacterium]